MKDSKICSTVNVSLHSYVYIKYGDERLGITFTKVEVIAKGSDLFFHTGCLDACMCEEFRKPLYYRDYKSTWFKSLKEIRKIYNIAKIDKDYYEVIGGITYEYKQ